ncbi:MAG: bifunctional alpha,alpha-trehalose-phosphate synthase (UDP-forming)/trehalose-phosphatase [Deltaproteobacteria bacterium]|nr:bifunctional alpha,alpha-trehalose-phosphate synthase (UDP-forming)/trehalose-phosphatase [Deltaproteobacteria bacterium]
MSRIIIVSNRLPITIKLERKQIVIEPSAGGLATGLWGPHQESQGLWFGWPGDVSRLNDIQLKTLEQQLNDMRSVPVYLTPKEHKRYYEGFSNGVLWPLCHYLIDRVIIESQDFGVYRQVNERFADIVASEYQAGDIIWVQDYHLMLLPQMLRERLPNARIGFFLHIPFPSSEVFRILPWRKAILEGLLGADLVGFHTLSYMRHFTGTLLRVLGVEAHVDQLTYQGREIRFGAFPMGIDAEGFSKLADTPRVQAEVEKIREEALPHKIFVAIDRLDYTKGIPRRMLAFERFLEKNPEMQEKVRFIQVAVPSRSGIGQYKTLRRQVEELLGRINGRFGTVSAVPIHSMYRSLSREEVVALYRVADVMVVTPLRDGLNLVAKEFCASRIDDDGVLVLSEFAGAAAELGEAIRVNPYDIDQVADAFKQALEMYPAERQSRMWTLRQRVTNYNVHRWVRSFLQAFEEIPKISVSPDLLCDPVAVIGELTDRLRAANELHLLLDYDGTLATFDLYDKLTFPDEELYQLIKELSQRSATHVYILSGCLRGDLEKWFGALPVNLYAEDGLWLRPTSQEWKLLVEELDNQWKRQVLDIMIHYVGRTPGTFVEDKTASVAWCYGNADIEFSTLQASELRIHLMGLLSNLPVEVLQGDKLIEVRMHGVHKGAAVRQILNNVHGGIVLAMGDDSTNVEMFAALPEDAYRIHVGPIHSGLKYCLTSIGDAREFLRSLL